MIDGSDISSYSTVEEFLAELARMRVTAAFGSGKTRLSLRDLSARSGVARSSLANYLAGNTLMPCDVLLSIVGALGADIRLSQIWVKSWERVILAGKHTALPATMEPGAHELTDGSRYVSSRFSGHQFSMRSIKRIDFVGVKFMNCSFVDTQWLNCRFENVEMDNCRLGQGLFKLSRFANVRFLKCDLQEISFQGNKFDDVEFEACSIEAVRFC